MKAIAKQCVISSVNRVSHTVCGSIVIQREPQPYALKRGLRLKDVDARSCLSEHLGTTTALLATTTCVKKKKRREEEERKKKKRKKKKEEEEKKKEKKDKDEMNNNDN